MFAREKFMTTQKERQAAYRERMKNSGFVQKTIWMPEKAAAAIDALSSVRAVMQKSDSEWEATMLDDFADDMAIEMWAAFERNIDTLGREKISDEEIRKAASMVMANLMYYFSARVDYIVNKEK